MVKRYDLREIFNAVCDGTDYRPVLKHRRYITWGRGKIIDQILEVGNAEDILWVFDRFGWPSEEMRCRFHIWNLTRIRKYADDRGKKVIDRVRRLYRRKLKGGATGGLTWDAAGAAAKDAAWAAAWDGAWDAAWAAARHAAWATARDAARAAEQQWQFDRLVAWLSDPEPEDWPLPERPEAMGD